MSAKESAPKPPVAVNRKARFDYTIEEEIEAGIALTGTEVKSLRAGRANIADAYAGEKNGALCLLNATIQEFAGGNRMNHDPLRPRPLLLHKKQIKKLLGRIRVKGTTLVPLRIYFNKRGFAKVMLGLAVGKKEYEKREVIKKREWKKEQGRLMRKK